jgi:hypothetical protein
MAELEQQRIEYEVSDAGLWLDPQSQMVTLQSGPHLLAQASALTHCMREGLVITLSEDVAGERSKHCSLGNWKFRISN